MDTKNLIDELAMLKKQLKTLAKVTGHWCKK